MRRGARRACVCERAGRVAGRWCERFAKRSVRRIPRRPTCSTDRCVGWRNNSGSSIRCSRVEVGLRFPEERSEVAFGAAAGASGQRFRILHAKRRTTFRGPGPASGMTLPLCVLHGPAAAAAVAVEDAILRILWRLERLRGSLWRADCVKRAPSPILIPVACF